MADSVLTDRYPPEFDGGFLKNVNVVRDYGKRLSGAWIEREDAMARIR